MDDFQGLSKPEGVNWSPSGEFGMVNYGSDRNKVVTFYTQGTHNQIKSMETGRPIFDNTVLIRMHDPGEKLNIIVRPVKDEDKFRFPAQWANFLANKTQVPEGTPIDLLFPNNPAVAETLKANGVYTVEQCSSLSAHAIDTLGMGAQEWKNKAESFIKNSTSGVEFNKIKEDNKIKDQKIALLERQLGELSAQFRALQDKLLIPTQNINPGFAEGYDLQTQKINNLSPSTEMAQIKNKSKK